MPKSKATPSEAAQQLSAFFRRNGYVRRQDRGRLADDGYREYKKGDEVRLVAESLAELGTIRRLLKTVGFKPGRPFAKARQWRQPVYGRAAVAAFLALIGVRRPARRGRARKETRPQRNRVSR